MNSALEKNVSLVKRLTGMDKVSLNMLLHMIIFEYNMDRNMNLNIKCNMLSRSGTL